MSHPPGLGPHLVGQRVVVRRLVRGETGPTGGPAFTDLLGVMESWAGGVTTVRAESGEVTEIRLADIVSGKPVPRRPSARLRVSAEEAERRANASWPALETEPLGEWLLRASGGFSSRANSALAAGDPGLPVAEASAAVRGFYGSRGLPAWAQVVVESDVHHQLDTAGWVPARPGEADTLFQLGSVARAARLLPAAAGSRFTVSGGTAVTPTWLDTDHRVRSHGDAAIRVLEGPEQTWFVTVTEAANADGPVVGRGRIAGDRDSDWAGITDVWVAPGHRRQGLAHLVLAGLLDWAAERGVTTAYLQVRGDNPGALALYERLGFTTHHAYRYLTPS